MVFTLSGREQFAAGQVCRIIGYSTCFAKNAGMDPIDTLTELRSKQAKGSKWSGIDARSAKIVDMSKLDIVEPLSVKEQIIKSATEVASMILRIDDVIASSKSGGGAPGGMPRHGRNVIRNTYSLFFTFLPLFHNIFDHFPDNLFLAVQ